MERNCSEGVKFGGENSCGGFDFQNQNQNQNQNNGERGKNTTSEDDDKKVFPWKRVKWIDKMVKLMISALSYLCEDSVFAGLQKKGKWRSVSKLMNQRGYQVSPQQCEDKFNDLNKRYKMLNEMLGNGISCDVVENPALLDKIDYLNEKDKLKVRKILSSKHLFYKEMCSYHNGNRLHLPHDSALQSSLHLILRSRDDYDNDDDDDDEYRDCRGINHGALGGPLKRMRQRQSHEDVVGHMYHVPQAVVIREVSLSRKKQNQWIESKSLKLEKHKLQIEADLMELERQRLKWETFCQKRDQKLEKMRMENERMKLENEKMTLELGFRLS